jgi:hypothetical protein
MPATAPNLADCRDCGNSLIFCHSRIGAAVGAFRNLIPEASDCFRQTRLVLQIGRFPPSVESTNGGIGFLPQKLYPDLESLPWNSLFSGIILKSIGRNYFVTQEVTWKSQFSL